MSTDACGHHICHWIRSVRHLRDRDCSHTSNVGSDVGNGRRRLFRRTRVVAHGINAIYSGNGTRAAAYAPRPQFHLLKRSSVRARDALSITRQ